MKNQTFIEYVVTSQYSAGDIDIRNNNDNVTLYSLSNLVVFFYLCHKSFCKHFILRNFLQKFLNLLDDDSHFSLYQYAFNFCSNVVTIVTDIVTMVIVSVHNFTPIYNRDPNMKTDSASIQSTIQYIRLLDNIMNDILSSVNTKLEVLYSIIVFLHGRYSVTMLFVSLPLNIFIQIICFLTSIYL
ncbi:hypothetical protein KUTeg_014496 [Tegillarca granosa]|uniref:Uncharacterized protein n=1 Tax=Tegillarca granosa TaxID=220873 RepID=A0ABQ9EWH6_TEGGR|nr:hypothetical protein KUTeg_014496 [Tegillarca granosa]